MTLCDTGPLVALIDRGQGDAHFRCIQALQSIRLPLVITWPVLTEAMYFAGKLGRWRMQELLWAAIADARRCRLCDAEEGEIIRARELMETYSDTPMDLADASLVAAAETLDVRRVFTLDSHFRVYRTRNGGTFEIIPE